MEKDRTCDFSSEVVKPTRRVWVALVLALLLCSGTSWAKPRDRPKGMESDLPSDLEVLGYEIHFGIDAVVQLDIIHDFDAIGLDADDSVAREFVPSSIPVGGPAAALRNRTVFSPNQSDLYLWMKSQTRYGEAKALVGFDMTRDLYGTEFQVYMAWAHLGYLRFGLDYSQFMNQHAIPETLDFEGPQVLPEIRRVQAALRIPIGQIGGDQKNLLFHIGLEDAGAEFTVPGEDQNAVNVRAASQVPALVCKFIYDTEDGNLQLAGVYRRMRAKGDVSYDSKLNGWGLYLSGSVDLPGGDSVMLGVLGGRGIAAYIDDTSGLDLDAAPLSWSDDRLKAVGLIGAWGAYKHFWRSDLRTTATFGYLEAFTDFIDRRYGPRYADQVNGDLVGIFNKSFYGSVNLIWNPIRWLDAGVEYLWGHQQMAPGTSDYDNDKGYDNRIQVTIRFNFDYSR